MNILDTGVNLVNRAADVVGAYGTHGSAQSNYGAEVEATARCTLIAGVLDGFIRYCYQGENGVYWNLSGNCTLPTGTYTPFSSAGKRRGDNGRAQLTHTERAIVRTWLIGLSKSRTNKPLFYYDSTCRRWVVDTVRYQTVEDAINWLQSNRLDAKTYLLLKNRLQVHS